MLIRIGENLFREFPEDLAALILSDPSSSDVDQSFSADDVNVLIHGIFGTHYDFSISYDENLNKVREIYQAMGQPDREAYVAAEAGIRLYNQNIDKEQIGLVDSEYLFTAEDSLIPKKII